MFTGITQKVSAATLYFPNGILMYNIILEHRGLLIKWCGFVPGAGALLDMLLWVAHSSGTLLLQSVWSVHSCGTLLLKSLLEAHRCGTVLPQSLQLHYNFMKFVSILAKISHFFESLCTNIKGNSSVHYKISSPMLFNETSIA